AIALEFNNIRLSYSDLNERANQLARCLIEQYSVQSHDLIGVGMERSENMIVAIFGILKSGATYVPIDPHFPQKRIDFILQDINAKVIVVDDKRQPDIACNQLVLHEEAENLRTYNKENLEERNSVRD